MTINLLTDKELEKLLLDQKQEIVINNIYQLYQIIDRVNLNIKENYNTPDCQRCGVCCSGVFEVSPIEAQIIRIALSTGFVPPGLFPPIPHKHLTHRLNLAKTQLSNAIKNNHFVCPFYNAQVGCLIYKVRTLICRIFEVAVPSFEFLDEVREELTVNSDLNSGILCPNLKSSKKYPKNFSVWNLEKLTMLLEKMYPGSTNYEARLLAFFKYNEKDFELNGLPVRFILRDYLKII